MFVPNTSIRFPIKASLAMVERLLQGVAMATNSLLTISDYRAAIDTALATLGAAIEVELISDILDLAKIEARTLELQPVALHLPSLLQSVVEICHIKATQKKIGCVYQPSSHLPDGVKVDEKRWCQVLINLLGNAIKFTESGVVTLRVEALKQTNTHASLLFQVIDTGIGIAEQPLHKLFEAFEPVGDPQKQSEGTGLGLAISQRIVKLMGGTLEVQSQLGQGSEFYFSVDIPLAKNWNHQKLMNGWNRVVGCKGRDPYGILLLRSHLEQLKVSNEAYSAFVGPLLHLTQTFQTETIEDCLQHT